MNKRKMRLHKDRVSGRWIVEVPNMTETPSTITQLKYEDALDFVRAMLKI